MADGERRPDADGTEGDGPLEIGAKEGSAKEGQPKEDGPRKSAGKELEEAPGRPGAAGRQHISELLRRLLR